MTDDTRSRRQKAAQALQAAGTVQQTNALTDAYRELEARQRAAGSMSLGVPGTTTYGLTGYLNPQSTNTLSPASTSSTNALYNTNTAAAHTAHFTPNALSGSIRIGDQSGYLNPHLTPGHTPINPLYNANTAATHTGHLTPNALSGSIRIGDQSGYLGMPNPLRLDSTPTDGTYIASQPHAPRPSTRPRDERTTHKIASTADLGRLVRERRVAMDLTQQNLADLAGTGRRFVSELEAGKPTLEIGKAIAVCRFVGIDLSAIVR